MCQAQQDVRCCCVKPSSTSDLDNMLCTQCKYCCAYLQAVKHVSKPLTPLLSQKPWKSNSPGPALAKSPNSAGMPSFQVTSVRPAVALHDQSVAFKSVTEADLHRQVLADVAAADAFAAKGASDIDARQMQATLRSLVADAVKSSTAQTDSSPPANAQQAMLRYALARHGRSADMHDLTQLHIKY